MEGARAGAGAMGRESGELVNSCISAADSFCTWLLLRLRDLAVSCPLPWPPIPPSLEAGGLSVVGDASVMEGSSWASSRIESTSSSVCEASSSEGIVVRVEEAVEVGGLVPMLSSLVEKVLRESAWGVESENDFASGQESFRSTSVAITSTIGHSEWTGRLPGGRGRRNREMTGWRFTIAGLPLHLHERWNAV
jgi:hypothetical protein